MPPAPTLRRRERAARLCLVLLLLPTCLSVRARAEAAAGLAPAAVVPAAEALATPAPEAPEVAALPAPAPDAPVLPPGVRLPQRDRSLVWRQGSVGLHSHERLVEVVTSSRGEGAPDAWLEVEYTVDPKLDDRVRALLRRGGVSYGLVVLIDPASGEIFSYVSTDPERFPATRPYPAASLMKVITAAALLRNEPEAAQRGCHYAGNPYSLLDVHLRPDLEAATMDSFRRALAISNNQCFARFAVHDLGEEALLDEVRRVGLLESPAPLHPPGRVRPVRADLDLGELASGLAGSWVTPLAAARLAALLADGALVRPYWVARVRDARGDPVELPAREPPRPVWTPAMARELRETMVGVTVEGTARRAFRGGKEDSRLGPIRVSGKTGTLRGSDPPGLYQWFIGVAPAEAPSVAIAAVVVNEGGSSASTVAAQTLEAMFCDGEDCEASNPASLDDRREAREARVRIERKHLARHDQLDAPPRPVSTPPLTLPRRLRSRPVEGRIVLLVELSPEGEVLDVQVDSSDLPDFEEPVVAQVYAWRFTPPTRHGQPVRALARLPIPIRVD